MIKALLAANFPTNTGFAWDTIEAVFARVAEHLREQGVSVCVSYPSLAGGEPAALGGTAVKLIEADVLSAHRSPRAAWRFARMLRRNRIRLLYLTDAPSWSPYYLWYRLAGVRTITVHDRTSGARRQRGSTVTVLKRVLHRLPIAADRFIAVSDFVARRLRDVNGTPPDRTFRVHNGIDLRRFADPDRERLRALTGLPAEVPIVVFAGRAQHYKGVGVLLDAVHKIQQEGRRLGLAICGTGDDLEDFKRQAADLGLRDTFFLGKRSDVAELLAGATAAVVPSLWEEAFGLAVVEGMAAGVPVIAARRGGIPELLEHDVTGILVNPTAAAIAAALERVLRDPAGAARMGNAARMRAFSYFNLERPAAQIAAILRPPEALPRRQLVSGLRRTAIT